jgi:hypothetical protein
MKVELIISKERVSYIVEELGQDKVTISGYNEDSDTVAFELNNPLDVLYMFHAGVKCGSDSMTIAWQK